MKTIVLKGLPNDEIYVNDVDPNHKLVTVRRKGILIGFIDRNDANTIPTYFINRGSVASPGTPVKYQTIRDLIEALKDEYSFHVDE